MEKAREIFSSNVNSMLAKADEAAKNPPIPLIRQINQMAHPTSIRLGLGELPYEVDPKVKEILSDPKPEHLRYCPNAGVVPLRKAVARNYGTEYDEDNVLITIGVQEAMFTALKGLKKLGAKKILIPEISFGIYKKIPQELGLEVASFKLDDTFGPDFMDLQDQLRTQKPDVVIINSPGNPTGRVLNSFENGSLALVLKENGSPILISDEIYNKLTFMPGKFQSMSRYENSIILDGISKSGAAAGLRVGWIFTKNKSLINVFTGISTAIKSSGPTNNQYAAIPVVDGSTDDNIDGFRKKLKQNHEIVMSHLADLPGARFMKSQGGFYCFPDVSYYAGDDTEDFCRMAASTENGVVVIPGKAFGKPGNIRISFANDQIEEGMRRLKMLLGTYRIRNKAAGALKDR